VIFQSGAFIEKLGFCPTPKQKPTKKLGFVSLVIFQSGAFIEKLGFYLTSQLKFLNSKHE
jgi:ribosomal protein S16